MDLRPRAGGAGRLQHAGRAMEEAREMLRDALLLMLETYREEASGSSKTARGRYPRDPKRVKRRDLLRHLRAHDCELLREGLSF